MKKLYILLLLSAMVISQCSCFRNFYNTRSAGTVTPAELSLLNDPGKTIIIHFDGLPVAAYNVLVRDSQLVATLSNKPWEGEKKFTPDYTVGVHTFRVHEKSAMESQVHVFTRGVARPENDRLVLPVAGITEIQHYTFNKGKTFVNHALSSALLAGVITGGVYLVLSIAMYEAAAAIFIF